VIVDKDIRGAVKVSHKEGEYNVDGKEGIDYIISDSQCTCRAVEETELKWGHPSCVSD
jgi:hypothetical protein